MNPKLDQIQQDYQARISQASTPVELEKIRVALLGRNGLINRLFSDIKNVPSDQRKQYGADLNLLKLLLEELINAQANNLEPQKQKIEKFDSENSIFGLPKIGHLHPITQTERRINALFNKLGFSIYDGPEIETDEFCFRRLNVPSDHPARDMQDSIYLKEPEVLLRTQTSSIEARLLAQEKPPFKAAFPGRVYRNEKVTHSNHFIFHQYQGVAVDKSVSLKDLIGVFNLLFHDLYGPDVLVRYRCKYYPEVEPGLGLDLNCFSCHGQGCQVCKGAGWIEMGGAGIIHPNVLKMAGIDPTVWRGFAFGLGLDRWVMAQFNIKDIRTLLGGNLAYKPNF
ncbi:MAG: phenylalanine--tRNA ligase subunit alpha [Candidatus Shapirobacteria bacterium]|jgi:phenylalanyl-tRNA synthetase alpha chain